VGIVPDKLTSGPIRLYPNNMSSAERAANMPPRFVVDDDPTVRQVLWDKVP